MEPKHVRIRACEIVVLAVKVNGKSEGMAIPIQAWASREGCTKLRLQEFADRRHRRVVRLAATRTSRLYPPGGINYE
jgi:hypothetical protein